MGTFTHSITVTNPDTRASLSVDALVDTGATFTMVPGAQLEALGLRPSRTVRVTLADGRQEELPAGRAEITVGDHSEISPCLFGPEGSPALLGAVTLEILLLAVDPARKTLVPTDEYLVAANAEAERMRREGRRFVREALETSQSPAKR